MNCSIFKSDIFLFQVNGGSLAEKAGLRVGDALIRVNTTDIFQLRHKEAQDTVARAGNNFELVVSRSVFFFFNLMIMIIKRKKRIFFSFTSVCCGSWAARFHKKTFRTDKKRWRLYPGRLLFEVVGVAYRNHDFLLFRSYHHLEIFLFFS